MAKHKFIEVMLQMFFANPSLVSPKQPPLQEGNNPIDMGKRVFGGVLNPQGNPLETHFFKWVISSPSIGFYYRSRLYIFYGKGNQTRSGEIDNPLYPNSSKPSPGFFDLHGHGNAGLFQTLSPHNLGLCAAYKSVVNLNSTRELLSSGSNHCSSQFMEPGPSSLRAFQAQDTLQACGADSWFLGAYPPHGAKPHKQRFSGAMHDGSSSQRSLMMTVGTFHEPSLVKPSVTVAALRTTKPLRPSLRKKILSASFFTMKSFFKLHQILGEIWSIGI
jgi:hypothetical protein